jgi:hypothetical protein
LVSASVAAVPFVTPGDAGTMTVIDHPHRSYRSGRSPDWLKMKNPARSAVKREAEDRVSAPAGGRSLGRRLRKSESENFRTFVAGRAAL